MSVENTLEMGQGVPAVSGRLDLGAAMKFPKHIARITESQNVRGESNFR